MCNSRFAAAALAILSIPALASAQDRAAFAPRMIMFPGSLNVAVGTIAPSEPGNVIGSATLEQGVTAWRRDSLFVMGFVDATMRSDSDHMSWNRTNPYTAGVKLVSVTNAGVLQAAVGVTAHASRGHIENATKAVYANYWTSWRGDAVPTSSRLVPDALPGHLWASSGIITAAEPDNWISTVSVQQGATVLRYAGTALVPFVGATANADTAGHAWNNRVQIDGGVKVVRAVMGGVIDAGVAQRREYNRMTQSTTTRPMVFVNFWLGWNPRHIRY